MKKKYHYFYKITNLINNHFYYGVHNTDNLDDGYMGSGKRLHYAYKKYGMENFVKEILKFFDTQEEAFEYESEMVTEELVKDKNCYNLTLGGKGWCTSGLKPIKDKNNNHFLVPINDERINMGEFEGVNKGFTTYFNTKTKCYEFVSITDKRIETGELISPLLGKVILINHETHESIQINVEDKEKYLKNGFVYTSTNKITVKDKQGNYYKVDKDDPRYLSGELVFNWTNQKHSEETKIKMKETHKKNKHQQGEKNSQFGTCWIHNNYESKKIKKEEIDIYLNNGWIKGRKMKF